MGSHPNSQCQFVCIGGWGRNRRVGQGFIVAKHAFSKASRNMSEEPQGFLDAKHGLKILYDAGEEFKNLPGNPEFSLAGVLRVLANKRPFLLANKENFF